MRRLIRKDYDEAFDQVDLIAGPVTATPAFKIGEKSGDPLAMYLVDLYTVSANLAGVPGIAFPCGFSTSGLPIGLQLQAPPFQEERLLRGAHVPTSDRLAHAAAAALTGSRNTDGHRLGQTDTDSGIVYCQIERRFRIDQSNY